MRFHSIVLTPGSIPPKIWTSWSHRLTPFRDLPRRRTQNSSGKLVGVLSEKYSSIKSTVWFKRGRAQRQIWRRLRLSTASWSSAIASRSLPIPALCRLLPANLMALTKVAKTWINLKNIIRSSTSFTEGQPSDQWTNFTSPNLNQATSSGENQTRSQHRVLWPSMRTSSKYFQRVINRFSFCREKLQSSLPLCDISAKS